MVNKFVTATLALLVLTPAVFTATVINTCELSKCSNCNLAADGVNKECRSCVSGYDREVKTGETLNSCVEQNPLPADCIDRDKTTGECDICKPGRVLKDKNCTTEGDLKDCESYRWSTSESKIKCSLCRRGYYLVSADNTCKEVISTMTGYDKECEIYREGSTAGTVECRTCKPGFMKFGGTTCTAYTGGSKGCDYAASATAACEYCRTEYSYYAVDHDATKGDICEYSSYINAIALTLALFFGMTQF